MWEKYYREYQNFFEISEILISSWIFKKFQLLIHVCMGEVRYHIADYDGK
jgi:hypothetical protein